LKEIKDEEAEKVVVEDAGDMGFSWLVMVFTVFMNAFVTMGLLYAYDTWYAEKIVTLNLDEKITVLRKDFLERKINEKELGRKLAALKAGIEGMADRRVILKREAIIAGGEDITDELE